MTSQDEYKQLLRDSLSKIRISIMKLNGLVSDIEASQYEELTWIDVGDAYSLALRLNLLIQDFDKTEQ